MPEAALPTSLKGWIVAAAASLIGLIAGFVFVDIANKLLIG